MGMKQEPYPPVKARVKLTLCRESGFFGPGVCELLEKIRETGSIRAAAALMEMSYTKAWKILNQAEEETGTNLITRTSGGRNGGSSTLTATGEQTVKAFREMEARLSACADELLKAYRRPFEQTGRTEKKRGGGTGKAEGPMDEFYRAIAGRDRRAQLTAAWILEGEAAGTRALFDRQGTVFRDEGFPAEAAETVRAHAGQTGITEWNGTRIFQDRIPGTREIVICGAGHVSLCLIRQGVMLGYDMTVIEDREEFAEAARNAGARRVICKPFTEALDEVGGDAGTAYVIMTREHSHDVECLRRILRKPYAYAGMMGSRSRAEEVRRQMLEEGFDERKVAQVHMPIGLKISSRTPEEIAVSVTAELIAVLNAAESGEGFPPGMAEELAEGTEGVLAMIVEKDGEAPRNPGTRMLVRTDGSFLGTVGGGHAEAEILRIARRMIRDGNRESRLARITMKKGTMHCGGEITVFLTAV